MSLANATNDKYYVIVSPTVNFKTTGLTTLWTTPVNATFLALTYTIVCDTATAANGDSVFNVGWTPATYTDFLDTQSPNILTANTYSNTVVEAGLIPPVFPASTAIVLNITSAETGTALTGRFIFSGIYL